MLSLVFFFLVPPFLPPGQMIPERRTKHQIYAVSCYLLRTAVISAKNHKRQRRKRQSVTAKREKSQTPKVLTAILTLPNLT